MDEQSSRARITAEAAEWWLRIGTRPPEQISYEDRQEFAAWLRVSPVHIAEILHIAHVHKSLGRFKLWGEIDVDTRFDEGNGERDNVVPLHGSSEVHRPSVKGNARQGMRLLGLAASVAITLGALMWAVPAFRGATYATDRAERREVVLNDGSVVQLEPETKIRVRLRKTQRLIFLDRGRALFRVARLPGRAFLVRSSDTTIRALGTAFGVEQTAVGTVITVSEGKVAVDDDVKGAAVSIDPHVEVLVSNQQLTIPRFGKTHRAVREVDSTRALAWAQGRLVFDSTPLKEVIEQFNRYNHVELSVDDPDLAQRPVSGTFQANDPETLISFIQAGASVTVHRGSDNRITMAKARAK